MNVKINNVETDKVNKTKFLGITVNENVTCEDHIALDKTIVSKNIYVMWKIINNLPRNTLKLFYDTLIHLYFIQST